MNSNFWIPVPVLALALGTDAQARTTHASTMTCEAFASPTPGESRWAKIESKL